MLDKKILDECDRLEEIGWFETAVEVLSGAIIAEPFELSYLINRGRILCSQLNRPEDAVGDFIKAITLKPNSAIPYQYLALCYLNLGKMDLACYHAELAVELDNSDAFSHYCLGKCRLDAKRYYSAAKLFAKAVDIDSKVAVFWDGLGGALYGKGDVNKAINAYERSISLHPNASSYIRLARIQIDTGLYDKAIKTLESAGQLKLNEAEQTLVTGYLEVASNANKDDSCP